MKRYCRDCRKLIDRHKRGGGRCHACAAKYSWIKGKYKHRDNSGKKNPRYKDGRSIIQHYCIDCNKKICCNSKGRCLDCKSKGKNNPNWLGGKSFEEYGAEFDNALKEQIRFRDNYKCQICGCPQIENGKQLDIHHKDYVKKNNDPENLISLCKHCHMKTNGDRKEWTKYFNEPITERR